MGSASVALAFTHWLLLLLPIDAQLRFDAVGKALLASIITAQIVAFKV